MKLIFCMQMNIKVSYKVMLSLLVKHDQAFSNTQSNKFAISLQYLKKLALSLLTEVARLVQNTQNKKLLIFLQYLKKIYIGEVFLYAGKHESFLQVDTNILGVFRQT